MVRVNDYIKHRRSMDVAAKVLAVFDDNRILVRWINQGFVKSFYLPVAGQIIKLDNDWLLANNPGMCLRYCGWSRI